jgi:hypothetical protein
MRFLVTLFMLCALAAAQTGTNPPADGAASSAAVAATTNQWTIPAGTKVPVVLKHAISTKGAHEGDSVYAETTFPVVINDRVLVPAGTYVQGRITHVQRAGRVKGRAEVLLHFTTLIYPSGYTVLLPGAIENVPGAEKTSMKDSEGTIREDSEKGDKARKAADYGIKGAGGGALGGALTTGTGSGAAIGAGIGGAVGVALAMLSRGSDVRLESGTTVEMVIQRDVPLDSGRMLATK